MKRTWENQFGKDYDVPQEILKLVAEDKLEDQSWGNDTCPRFGVLGDGVILLVDHPDPDKREMKPTKRFRVDLFDAPDDGGDFIGNAIATDSITELLHYLKDHWDIN